MKTIFLFGMLLSAGIASAQQAPRPDVPRDGFWEVITHGKEITVRFYDLDQHLLAEEHPAKKLNLRRRKVREALEQNLRAALLRAQALHRVRPGGPDRLEAQRQ